LPAADALRRSLNVPAILVAEGTGLSRCIGLIEAAGIALPGRAAARSGLAVVVGASEVTLLDLTNGYATLGRGGIRQRARLFLDEPDDPVRVLDVNVCAALDDILSSGRRRPHGTEDAAQVPWFMWKTGTSSGRRDAWAVGHNGRFAVGVWVGRFSGAGAAALVGAGAAEPLLAALFCSPLLRAEHEPVPPMPWAVRHPLTPPAEVAGPLRILSPADGSTFLASGTQAVIHPRANQGPRIPSLRELTWFLNGMLVAPEQVERLVLSRGTYELRCTDGTGNTAAVRFLVR
jgi:membrane carboxypeptidase/penicillin-binding protein PbpC